MDSNIAHESISSVNGRKRKAEGEDAQISSPPDATTSETIMVDSVVAAAPNLFSNAPRQPPSAPWLSPPAGNGVWTSANAPPVSPLAEVSDEVQRSQKRPRIEREQLSPLPTKKHSRKSRPTMTFRPLPHPPSRFWSQSDIRDMGLVPTKDPERMSNSLYHVKGSDSCAPECRYQLLPFPLPPIDLESPHIPVLQPVINRQTLEELDLNTILQNPQLRHDLLFDPGLHFRPGRQKRGEHSEKYWNAVTQELENGCTCVSFDLQGKPSECVCVCRRVPPPPNPVLDFSTARPVRTWRMPSRVRPLLTELLDLLLCVIQPLSGISGYVSPNTLQAQRQQHAMQATRLRSVFDPDLIEQEIRHGVFDPSGLFQAIGQVLKAHCAPMRDQIVEAMVEVARSCAPGGSGTKADAVKAVRMCLDILVLMKLDIANHQLQTLRPFLIETSGQFELKAFHRRQGASVRLTREWLQTAHQHLLASETLPHPTLPSSSLSYRSLNRTLQAYVSVLKGFTELIFDPPSPKSSSESPVPTSSHSVLPIATALPGFPETSFLDSARLATLSTDAADATAMYMFLMLYRQLVFFDPSPRRGVLRELPKITDSDLSQLKTEIRDIASCRLGYCFTRPLPDEEETCGEGSAKKTNDKEWKRWQKGARDVVLQIAMRATEAQNRAKTSSSSSSSTDRPILHQQPDDRMVQLAERWLDTNLQRKSALTVILRDRLRDAVFHRLLATTFPPRDAATGGVTHSLPRSAIPIASPSPSPSPGTVTGMESLTGEIRTLTNKLSKLSLIHLGVYLPLYEQDGFIQS